MKKNVNSELIDEENPEWTDGVFKRAASLEESGLPESFKVTARRGRPPKANPKVSTTIRFDADIIEAFKLITVLVWTGYAKFHVGGEFSSTPYQSGRLR